MDLLRGMLEMDPEKRYDAQQALDTPLFQEGAFKDIDKYKSIDDIDTQLRKFKDKFISKNKKPDEFESSMQFNMNPELQNGVSTLNELSQNQSNNGSNNYIFSIDNSANGSDKNLSGDSANGSKKGVKSPPKTAPNIYKNILKLNTYEQAQLNYPMEIATYETNRRSQTEFSQTVEKKSKKDKQNISINENDPTGSQNMKSEQKKITKKVKTRESIRFKEDGERMDDR